MDFVDPIAPGGRGFRRPSRILLPLLLTILAGAGTLPLGASSGGRLGRVLRGPGAEVTSFGFPPTMVPCAADPDCDDLDPCNGAETCDVATGQCLPGAPLPDSETAAGPDGLCNTADDNLDLFGIDGRCGTADDATGDGVCDVADNCPVSYNPAQVDSDSDGMGDACDQAACPPARLTAAPAGSMRAPRAGHAAVELLDGRILLVGGTSAADPNDDAAEVYDPGLGVFAVTGTVGAAPDRVGHTATLLADGRVLVVGGFDPAGGGSAINLVFTYSDATEAFMPTGGPLAAPRGGHTATLLGDGRVAVIGGTGETGPLGFIELYDPTADSWSSLPVNLATARFGHTATLLPDGRILVAGGQGAAPGEEALATAEVVDLVAGTVTATGSPGTARRKATAVLLSNGLVLITGGEDAAGAPLASSEIYSPTTGAFAPADPLMGARAGAPADLVLGDLVLVSGGTTNALDPPLEAFDALTQFFFPFFVPIVPRTEHTATVDLTDPNADKVLIVGGRGADALPRADADRITIQEPVRRVLFGTIGVTPGLTAPGPVNWLVATARAANLFSAAIDVRFNPSVVDVTGASPGPAFAGRCTAQLGRRRPGSVRVTMSCPGGVIAGGATALLNLTFLGRGTAGQGTPVQIQGAMNGGADPICAQPGAATIRPASGRLPDREAFRGTQVSIDATPSGNVTLTWDPSCNPSDTDYAVYRGTPGGPLTNHTPVLCATGGATSVTFPAALAAGEAAYFLVAPHNGETEGSYGRDPNGGERTHGAAACLPQQVGACPGEPGSTCAAGPDCASGTCADGVCCDGTCASACEACNLAGASGTCTPHPANTDPEGGCAGLTCDGNGACLATCASDADCSPGHACDLGTGQCHLDDGEACAADAECLGGACCAGVCRDLSDDPDNCGACGFSCGELAFCTVGMTCSAGVCAGGAPRSCDDSHACTADSCDEAADACMNDSGPADQCLPSIKEPPLPPPAEPCDCAAGYVEPPSPASGLLFHSGEFYRRFVDLHVRGRGLDFLWVRTYRSRIGPNTPMGMGWDHSYNIFIRQAGSDIRIFDGAGRADLYRLQADGTWTRPEFFRVIARLPDGSYRLSFADTSQWNFNALDGSPAAGKIASIVDRNGNTIAFAYDPATGLLAFITDTLGRIFVVRFDADGFIESVEDFTGRKVRYAYYQDADPGGSFGDLKSATSPAVVGTPNGNDFPSGKTETYLYTEGFPDERLNHNMAAITDPKGQTFLQNVYSVATDPNDPSFDRLERQDWGEPGDTIDVVHVPQTPDASNNFATVKAIVNDRVGDVQERFYNVGNQIALLRQYTGRADPDLPTTDASNRPVGPLRPTDPPYFETRFDHNADSLRTRTVLPRGNSVLRVYASDLDGAASARSRGNLMEIHRDPGPVGGDQPIITETIEYHVLPGGGGTNLPVRHVDGRGNAAVAALDARGNVLSLQDRIASVVTDFVWNVFGQPAARILPDKGSGHRRRDEFHYFGSGPQRGYLRQVVVDAGGLALTHTYAHTNVGMVTAYTDPRGNDRRYVLNALDQVIQASSPEIEFGLWRYTTDVFYDLNDNVDRVEVENRDAQGVLQPNTHWTTTITYDTLNELLALAQEIVADSIRTVVERVLDENGDTILERYGEAVNGNQPANAVQYQRDERRLLFRKTRAPGDPAQSTDQVDYDGNGSTERVTRGLEAAPRVWTMNHDGYDRQIGGTDPMGNSWLVRYDAEDNVVYERFDGELVDQPGSAANVRLHEATQTFDPMNRRVRRDVAFFDLQTQAPLEDGFSTTRWEFTDSSQVFRLTTENGNVVTVTYDGANRPRIVVTDLNGNSITYTRDRNGNVVRMEELEKSDLGNPDQVFTATAAYDNLDRPKEAADNAGQVTRFAFGSLGLEEVTDPRGNKKKFVRDGRGRRTQTIRLMTDTGDGTGSVVGSIITTNTWDGSGRLVASTDGRGNVTRTALDALNRPIVTRFADGTLRQVGSGAVWPLGSPAPDLSAFVSGYDVHDDPLQVTEATGTVIQSVPDLLGRVASRNITPGPGVSADTTSETYLWDGRSRMVDGQDDDSKVTLRHDSRGSAVQEGVQILPGGTLQIVSRLFDGAGNKREELYPSGRRLRYTPDARRRVVTIEDVTSGVPSLVATHMYAGPRRLERRILGNGTQLDVEHDPARRVSRTIHTRLADGVPLVDRSSLWDAAGNMIQRTNNLIGQVQTLAYDSINQLKQWQTLPFAPVIYTLDGAGSRAAVAGPVDPGAYAMDANIPPGDAQVNQYTTTPFDSRLYTENGALTETSPGPVQLGRDYREQITQLADFLFGIFAGYRYDVFGREIEKNVSGSITRYVHSGTHVVEEQDPNDNPTASYVWGPALAPHEVESEQSFLATGGALRALMMSRGGQEFYLHEDFHGSARVATDAAAAVVEEYRYVPFGQFGIFDAAGNQLSTSAIGNPYTYKGYRFEEELGYYIQNLDEGIETKAPDVEPPRAGGLHLDPRAGRLTERADGPGSGPAAGASFTRAGGGSQLGNLYTYQGNNPESHGAAISVQPFLTAGVPSSHLAVIVGDMAAGLDVVGAVDIIQDLQMQAVVKGGALVGSSFVVEGNAVEVGSSSDLLEINETIFGDRPSIPIDITDTLNLMRRQRRALRARLGLEDSGAVVKAPIPYAPLQPLLLEFAGPYAGFYTLGEYESKRYSVPGKEYEVEVLVISETAPFGHGALEFGHGTLELEDPETDVLADGTEIGIRDILATGKDVQKSIFLFYLGAYKVEFNDLLGSTGAPSGLGGGGWTVLNTRSGARAVAGGVLRCPNGREAHVTGTTLADIKVTCV